MSAECRRFGIRGVCVCVFKGVWGWEDAQYSCNLTVVFGLNALGGQAAAAPVHASARSQNVVLARHEVPAGLNVLAGHAAAAPSQTPATSHMSAVARHVTPAAFMPSAGHARLVPSQTSATSQSSAEARHATPAASAWPVLLPQVTPEQTASVPLALPSSALPSAPAVQIWKGKHEALDPLIAPK